MEREKEIGGQPRRSRRGQRGCLIRRLTDVRRSDPLLTLEPQAKLGSGPQKMEVEAKRG